MWQIIFAAIIYIITSLAGNSWAQTAISSEIAPTGKLHVAMNAGTPVLLMRTPEGKVVDGVGLEVGKFVAEKLGVSFELVPYANANAYIQSFGKGEWDIGFGSPTPLIAEKADFIVDVVLTDSMFVAGPGREFADVAQVDQPEVKIGVGTNTSADQFLSRTLQSAQLVRISGGGGSIGALRSGQVHVWAANAGNAHEIADRLPGAKLVPGPFNSEPIMMILPKGVSSATHAGLVEIVKEAKRSGIVSKAIERLGVKGVRAAPE
jgi:polar amino acid transport system substrate-binding protein